MKYKDNIIVTFSLDEAEALRCVCRLVGGSQAGIRGLFSTGPGTLEYSLSVATGNYGTSKLAQHVGPSSHITFTDKD